MIVAKYHKSIYSYFIIFSFMKSNIDTVSSSNNKKAVKTIDMCCALFNIFIIIVVVVHFYK